MCGRCRFTLRADDVPRACNLRNTSVRHVDVDRYRPSHNVSPGSYLPVLRRDHGGDEGYTAAVHCMKWGLIPSFIKKDEKPDHYKMFNARSESVCEKASFRRLVPNNRCLVVVEGFYEWKKGPKKQPYYIHFKDGRPLVFAGLYDSWKNAEGEVLYTFTILTTDSSSALQWLHDRMPVILGDEASTDIWLNGSSDTKFSTLLKPYEKPDLVWYPVTTAMNKASFDGPECIKEIQLKSEEQSNPITKFFSKKGTVDKAEKSLDEDSTKINVQGGIKEESKIDEQGGIKEKSEINVQGDIKEESKIDEQGDIKEEFETQSSVELSSPTKNKGVAENFDVSACSPGTDAKVEVKRDYEEFLADSKPSTDGFGKLPPTPLKKSKVKSGAEKQTTLNSFFAKS